MKKGTLDRQGYLLKKGTQERHNYLLSLGHIERKCGKKDFIQIFK